MLRFSLLKCTDGVFETENDRMYATTASLIYLFFVCLMPNFLFCVSLCFACLSLLEFILSGGGIPTEFIFISDTLEI